MATGFVRIVILFGGLYTPYGWSGGGGGGRTSHIFRGCRSWIGALYSLDDGLAENFMHESSDWAPPRCKVTYFGVDERKECVEMDAKMKMILSLTVAYGSGGADALIFGMI